MIWSGSHESQSGNMVLNIGSHESQSGNMVLNMAKYDFNMDK